MKSNDIKIVDAPAGLDKWGALPRALRATIGTDKRVRVPSTTTAGGYSSMFKSEGFSLHVRTKGRFKYLWLEPREKGKP